MAGRRKRFEESEHKDCDLPAKLAVKNYLKKTELVEINTDRYGIDLLGRYFNYEVEVKRVWKTRDWPTSWKTVHIPERKGVHLTGNKPVFFFVLSDNLKRAIIISDFDVRRAPLREIPNAKVSKGEKMFDIPIENCRIVSLRGIIESRS